MKNVLPEILDNQSTINEGQIIEILTQSNFNTLKFANYVNNIILSELNTEDYLEDQLMILLEKEKEYNQIIISINDGYEPELQTITRQVITWIEQEIKYCKKKLKNRIVNQGQIEFKPRTLFQTSMSVNQLACLFKAFKDVEAITNPVQKDLFKAVADSFVTDHTKTISSVSLYNKHFDVDDASKEAVRQVLRKMLKSIV